MRWIGVTGGIATGKSTVAKWIREAGYNVIDADDVAHKVLLKSEPTYHTIVDHFGKVVLDQSGEIDRSKLGALVFSDPSELEYLERIIHPVVQKRVQAERRDLESKGVEMAFYDVPLLFEKKLQDQFDSIVVVYSPKKNQIERLKSRNGMEKVEAENRISQQIDIEEKRLKADFVVDNSNSLAELKSEVKKLLAKLKK